MVGWVMLTPSTSSPCHDEWTKKEMCKCVNAPSNIRCWASWHSSGHWWSRQLVACAWCWRFRPRRPVAREQNHQNNERLEDQSNDVKLWSTKTLTKRMNLEIVEILTMRVGNTVRRKQSGSWVKQHSMQPIFPTKFWNMDCFRAPLTTLRPRTTTAPRKCPKRTRERTFDSIWTEMSKVFLRFPVAENHQDFTKIRAYFLKSFSLLLCNHHHHGGLHFGRRDGRHGGRAAVATGSSRALGCTSPCRPNQGWERERSRCAARISKERNESSKKRGRFIRELCRSAIP